ncbi:MAG: aspartyl protease family protein [Thermoplasmata archaeon]
MEGFDNAPFAPGFVSVPRIGVGLPVMFLVDTGNSKTAISEPDSVKLGLNPRELPTPKSSSLDIGGRGNVRILRGPVIVSLVDTENRFHEIEFDEINVLMNHRERIRVHGRERRASVPYPALLGRDFLPTLGCSVRFNFRAWDMWIDV